MPLWSAYHYPCLASASGNQRNSLRRGLRGKSTLTHMQFSTESYGLSTAAGRVPYVPIQFYDSDDRCPFAAKTWLTLIEKGINFERISIDLKNKPQEFAYLFTSLNPDPSATAQLPLIVGTTGCRIFNAPMQAYSSSSVC